MRARVVVGCVLALVAVGSSAVGAFAANARPALWLIDPTVSPERVANGTPTVAYVTIEGCTRGQDGALEKNGKPSDVIKFGEALETEEGCSSANWNWAGALSSVTVSPSGTNEVTMTAKDKVHVFIAPWCVYTLAKTFTFPARSVTQSSFVAVTSPLDKSASFGTCAATRSLEVAVQIYNDASGAPFFGEVTG